ncbi:alanine:cation symporter family protein [Nonomuraea diastatica]|uniref:Sodium:alanine symporter family protein n=1 Tax=Nonomuraea diastatica TaxID=1848329 RepID=A0A4R4WTN7_9ACTN|nr:sodium:alanine symporter family protein [Nonomuraea diastatica]
MDAALADITDGLWTYLLIPVVVLLGLFFTIQSKGVQFRMFPEMFRAVVRKSAPDREGGKAVSSFGAFTISAAARVGTGNVAGVTAAITQLQGDLRAVPRKGRLRLPCQLGEGQHVQLVRADTEPVADRVTDDPVDAAQRGAKGAGVGANVGDRRAWWPAPPEDVHHGVQRRHPVGVEQQGGEELPWLFRGQPDDLSTCPHRQRPEAAETQSII